MTSHAPETVALVALLHPGVDGTAPARTARGSARSSEAAVRGRDPLEVLDERHGLLAHDEFERAAAQVREWRSAGIEVVSAADESYPVNLRSVAERPLLLFVVGRLQASDARAVAVVGTRAPSERGIREARAVSASLVAASFTVTSGLAAGIDTVAHTAALAAGWRTIAVLGTGVDRCYPPENAGLQREISERCAIVASFAPGSPPTRHSFPARNVVMSALSLATVIIEASATSGTRIQARAALRQGRPVLLAARLLEQDWAVELAAHAGVLVFDDPDSVPGLIEAARADIHTEVEAC